VPETGGFAVRAFGCNIHVAGEGEDAQTVLERYVFPSLPRTVAGDEKPDLVLRIAPAGGGFQLSVNEAAVASAAGAIDLVPELVRALDEAVLARLSALRAVHAGVVLLGGRALLLPGATHSGKSSLVAELLRRGAVYYSDEYALIDPEGHVHPYPRPLLLRAGRPEQVPARAEDFNAQVGDGPAPVGWILALEYEPVGAWSIVAVPQSMALLTLLRNTPHILAESPDIVRVFHRAVARAACYAGSRADAVDAVEHILRLIDGAR